jgi:hypothetical protein
LTGSLTGSFPWYGGDADCSSPPCGPVHPAPRTRPDLPGQPIVSGGRAVVEWWAAWTEQSQKLNYAAVTVLGFDGQG